MPFCPQGHGQSCFYCENCDCHFTIECLDVPSTVLCPRCGSEDTTDLGERLIGGKTYSEYESVEDYERIQENKNSCLCKTLDI